MTRVPVLRERVRDLAGRAERSLSHTLNLRRTEVNSFAAQLRALNPDLTLARGYAIVTDSTGKTLNSITQATELLDKNEKSLNIRVKDGTFAATIAQTGL